MQAVVIQWILAGVALSGTQVEASGTGGIKLIFTGHLFLP
ncbi:hypothetical protein BACUNI_00614 [Bacteroides uniformis ATCC 8492]|jgi:hypothetical protein|uniref:Uncharacterized protein n=1 Tax=Bacteroides uniformis (strain ATCC 8492 / DSM 6597 / CCUG 4942 / CIP 103695 / JCM 5828 / KCTC 5204 / NCTC 13054 / VPI 0061) TaxID=411479 RepID=A0ABC9NGW3_BACUC|nr:hypothetical protein BACUNI_00614 [Bacteroides uniformis ATCC 8492]